MTSDELAQSYFNRSAKRCLALELRMQHEAFPDVVLEAQEIVELVLKDMLRAVGVDPPKWHDVGQITFEHTDKFPPAVRNELPDVAAVSRRLRRDGEAAFYGDTDLIPEPVFDRAAAQQALDEVRRVLAGVRHFASDAG